MKDRLKKGTITHCIEIPVTVSFCKTQEKYSNLIPKNIPGFGQACFDDARED